MACSGRCWGCVSGRGWSGLGWSRWTARRCRATLTATATLDYDQIAREIIADAIATDAAEDELYGDKRGDELPEDLPTHEGRREWLRRELGRDRETNHETGDEGEFDADRIVDRIQGRQGWTREARRHLEVGLEVVGGDLARPDLTERLGQDAGGDWLVLLLVVEVPAVGDVSDDSERSAEAAELGAVIADG